MHLISFMHSKVTGFVKAFDLRGCDFLNISAAN